MKALVVLLLLAGCAVQPPVKSEPKIISVIGLGECDHWLGGIAVTSDGQLHGSNDMSSEQAAALAKGLPEGTSMLAMAPCMKEPPIGT